MTTATFQDWETTRAPPSCRCRPRCGSDAASFSGDVGSAPLGSVLLGSVLLAEVAASHTVVERTRRLIRTDGPELQPAVHVARRVTPDAVQCGPRCPHRAVDVRCAAVRSPGQHLAGRGVEVLERLRRVRPAAADEQAGGEPGSRFGGHCHGVSCASVLAVTQEDAGPPCASRPRRDRKALGDQRASRSSQSRGRADPTGWSGNASSSAVAGARASLTDAEVASHC